MWRAAMAAMCASKPRRRAACALACTCRADLSLRPESSERVGYPLINGYGCLRPRLCENVHDRRARSIVFSIVFPDSDRQCFWFKTDENEKDFLRANREPEFSHGLDPKPILS